MSGRAVCGLGLALLVHGGASAQVPAGGEFRVNTYTTGRQWRPSVAAAGDGSFVVVWDSSAYDGNGTSVLAQRYDGSGLPRGAEFRIDMPEAGSDPVNEPASVSSTLDGRFVAVWFDGRGSGGIFARRYDTTGVPLGPDFPVNTAEGFGRRTPTVGSAGDGGFVVVWEDLFGPDGAAILGRRFDASGNPLGAEFQANTVTGAGTPESPDVAVAPDGRFVVTWSNATHEYSRNDVFARRYDSSGNPLGAQFRVSTYTSGTQRSASVGMGPGGQFVVVWEDWYAFNIVGRRFDAAGNPVGTEFEVGEDTSTSRPAVSMAADGGFTVVWETFYYFEVFARRYDSSGQPEGPGFRVHSFSPDIQDRPAVASAPNGAFVVAWNSDDAELSNGVFARRYRAPDLVFADGFE